VSPCFQILCKLVPTHFQGQTQRSRSHFNLQLPSEVSRICLQHDEPPQSILIKISSPSIFPSLRSPSCRSVIEIIDVNPNGHKKSLFKVCSPTARKARNDLGAFIPPQTFVSSSNQIIVVLRRSSPPHELNDIEVGLNLEMNLVVGLSLQCRLDRRVTLGV
jgi:hypothetical protein